MYLKINVFYVIEGPSIELKVDQCVLLVNVLLISEILSVSLQAESIAFVNSLCLI